MNKKNNKKGFTLAELLIVVAIIAVLVAIAIPVFTAQLEKSREATDAANIRAKYADAVVFMLDNTTGTSNYSVKLQQAQKGWQNPDLEGALNNLADSGYVTINVANPTAGQTASIGVAGGSINIGLQ